MPALNSCACIAWQSSGVWLPSKDCPSIVLVAAMIKADIRLSGKGLPESNRVPQKAALDDLLSDQTDAAFINYDATFFVEATNREFEGFLADAE